MSLINGDQIRKSVREFLPGSIAAAVMIAIGFVFFANDSAVLSSLVMGGIGIAIFPYLYKKYSVYSKKRDTEEKFPIFLRDFVEAVRGGMTVPAAFHLISRNDYGALNPYVKKISAKLEWGIPVDKVLLSFARETKSNLIGRIISSVIESHRYGGRLAETFEALSKTAVEVDRLKEERKFFLQSQMMTGYIIFFVFLGVIISLQTFLVPSLTSSATSNISVSQASPDQIASDFKDIFRNLILIQGLFAGLSVGKMAEGAMIAGLKHSMIMMLVGGAVFFFFGNAAPPIPT